MPAPLRRLKKATAIARQLVTHDGYMLRRIAQESLGAAELAAAEALSRVPGKPLRSLERQCLAQAEVHYDAVLRTALRLGEVCEKMGDHQGAEAAYRRVVDRMRHRQTENILVKLLGRLVRNTGQGKNLGEAVAHSDIAAFHAALQGLERLGVGAALRQPPWHDPATLHATSGTWTGADLAAQRKAMLADPPQHLAPDALRRWLAQDPDDAWAWRVLAERLVAAGTAAALQEAEAAARAALALEPQDALAWRALGMSLAAIETAQPGSRRRAPAQVRQQAVQDAWRRASALDPQDAEAFWRARGLAVRAVLDAQHVRTPAAARRLEEAPLTLARGQSAQIAFEITAKRPAAVMRWALAEPYGLGVTAEPHADQPSAGPHAAGSTVVAGWTLRGQRPHHVLGADAQGWTLVLHLWVDGEALALPFEVAVPDEAPGELLWIITEDHELHEHDETISAEMAREILVDVSKYAEQQAGERGVPWTHMVEAGSALALLDWTLAQAQEHDADAQAVGKWRQVRDDAVAALAEGVAAGHDLGIHLHAFNTPECANFAYSYDAQRHVLACSDRFLLAHGPERGYFAKAFARLGDADNADGRLGGLLSALERIEAVGRLGRPGFQALLFRAGSFEFSDGAGDDVRSLRTLRRAGVPADSSWPKPSFYTAGPPHNPLRASRDGYQKPANGLADHGTMEIRAEYNIEGDYLADADILRRYLSGRIAHFAPGGHMRPGVHVLCAMTHDKYINGRMGQSALPLQPDNGDWATVRRHLDTIDSLRHVLTPVTAGQAVRRWLDLHTPEPLPLRCGEELVPLPGDAGEETVHVLFELCGRDIPIDAAHPARVGLRVPAALRRQALRAQVLADGRVLAEGTDAAALRRLEPIEAELTSRPARLELVVRCARGPSLLGCAFDGDALVADLHFRAASVRLADGTVRSGLRFEPCADGRFRVSL